MPYAGRHMLYRRSTWKSGTIDESAKASPDFFVLHHPRWGSSGLSLGVYDPFVLIAQWAWPTRALNSITGSSICLSSLNLRGYSVGDILWGAALMRGVAAVYNAPGYLEIKVHRRCRMFELGSIVLDVYPGGRWYPHGNLKLQQ